MKYLIDVLRWKYAGCQYNTGETYDSLQWLDKNIPKPTEDELLKWDSQWETNATLVNYKELRQLNYPSIGDQLDMLWQAMDTNQIPTCVEFYNAINVVKQEYPKPGDN